MLCKICIKMPSHTLNGHYREFSLRIKDLMPAAMHKSNFHMGPGPSATVTKNTSAIVRAGLRSHQAKGIGSAPLDAGAEEPKIWSY